MRSPRGYYVLRTDTNFPRGLSNRHVFFKNGLSVRRTHHRIISSNRNPYLVLEHIRIVQESLFPHRTDIRFPERLI